MFALLIWALAFLPFLHAVPTSPLSHRSTDPHCTNMLPNPSFEAGIDPWLGLALGAWHTRGVSTSTAGGHNGKAYYSGESNATTASSILSVSQSGLEIPSGTTVECAAWVASRRPGNVGSTSVTVFIDDQTCGSPVSLGTTTGWVRVGGKVTVSGDSHNIAVVVGVETTGPGGSVTWIDDALVGIGC